MIFQLVGYPLLAMLAIVANQDPPASQAKRDSGAALRSPTIAVKRTEATKVAYLRHEGTYWTVGSTFARVREEMVRRGWSGPMFARFRSPPGRGSSQSGIEVGCVLSDGSAPEKPFNVKQRSPELVAYLTLKDRAVATRRDYDNLKQWAIENGYTPAGPCIEIYASVTRSGSSSSPRTEVQLALQDPETSDANVAAESETRSTVQADSKLAPAPASVAAPQEPAEGNSLLTTAGPANPVEATPATFLPKGCEMTDASILWLGQIVFRLEAAARGIARMDADQGEAASTLVKTVRDAYDGVAGDSKVKPLDQSVVRVDLTTTHAASGQRAITRSLDRLLGEISFKRVDGPGAQKTLELIVKQVRGAVCRAKTSAVAEPDIERK